MANWINLVKSDHFGTIYVGSISPRRMTYANCCQWRFCSLLGGHYGQQKIKILPLWFHVEKFFPSSKPPISSHFGGSPFYYCCIVEPWVKRPNILIYKWIIYVNFFRFFPLAQIWFFNKCLKCSRLLSGRKWRLWYRRVKIFQKVFTDGQINKWILCPTRGAIMFTFILYIFTHPLLCYNGFSIIRPQCSRLLSVTVFYNKILKTIFTMYNKIKIKNH